jgi:hypothetical protein
MKTKKPQFYGPWKRTARDVGMLPTGHYWCSDCQKIVTSRKDHGELCPVIAGLR